MAEDSNTTTTSHDDLDDMERNDDDDDVISVAASYRSVASQRRAAARLCRNRTRMTILHFVLTYPRWSLSLFLLLASASLPLPSVHHAVRQPIQQLQQIVQQESDLYEQCVRHAFERVIGTKLNQTIKVEYKRVQQLQRGNQDIVQQAKRQSMGCFNASFGARRALQTWQRMQPIPLFDEQCTVQDRANLSHILGQDYSLVENEVATVVDSYVDRSRSSLNHVVAYAERRAQYDYDYFIGVKLTAALDILTNLTTPSIDLDQFGILDELRDAIQRLLDALRDAHVRVELLTVRLHEFHASLQQFHLQYVDLYGRLSLASNFVRDFLPSGIPLPPYFDLSGIPTADFLLPPIFEVPSFAVELPRVETLLAEYLVTIVQSIQRFLAQLADAIQDQIRMLLEELLEQLRNLLALEDYDPPKYVGSHAGIPDVSAEFDFLATSGEAARQHTADALERIQRPPAAPIVDEEALPHPDLNVSSRRPDLEAEATSFLYLQLEFPTITLPELVESFLSLILLHQWIFELVIQSIRLWRLKKRYERDATPALPEIDFGSDEEKDNEDDQKSSHNNTLAVVQATLLKHFMTPWMALGLVLFPFAILGVTVWYPHVRNTCVHSRKGTILALGFIAPLLFNKASIPGNTLYTASELDCQRQQRLACNRLFAASDAAQRQTMAAMKSARSRFDDSLETVHLFDRCVDTTTLDQNFRLHCCGLEGYQPDTDSCATTQITDFCPIDNTTKPSESFRPVGEYLASPFCSSMDFDKLNYSVVDARFDCSVIEHACHGVPCPGVDRDIVWHFSVEADCRVQVYIMKCCLLVLLSLYHAIVINICSTLAFSAIKHLNWRALRPDGLQLKTKMSENGELIKGSSIKERSARIAKAMYRFELSGWVQLIVGNVMFVAWLVSFFLLRYLLADFNEA